MDEPTLRRIAVDRESDWMRVQENITTGLQRSLDARLATLPGGRDGAAAQGVKRELEERIKKVRVDLRSWNEETKRELSADERSGKKRSY